MIFLAFLPRNFNLKTILAAFHMYMWKKRRDRATVSTLADTSFRASRGFCHLQYRTRWNVANYLVRQSFIFEHVYLDNVKVYHLIKGREAYKALPAKVANQVLIQLHKAWVAFFEVMEEWRVCPEKFTGQPKLPGYKHKTDGRNLLVYEKKAIPAKPVP